MRNKILLILLFLFFIYPCFAKNEYEKKTSMINNYKDTCLNFTDCNFYAKCSNDYKTLEIRYQSKTEIKDFSLSFDSYVEQLSIIKTDGRLFWFSGNALGFEQYYIWNSDSGIICKPFFDMQESVTIRIIDYNNQILFGDTWNSDKGIMPTQKVELYLFSTSKKEHYKIAEKCGDSFCITLLENQKIQYMDSDKKLVVFDYSDWIKHNVSYLASSFLMEGKTVYGADNLSSKEGLPWASANGFGINDTIRLSVTSCEGLKLSLYNGFQSESRPDLYKANSRVKKISIRNLETNISKEFLLKDIQNEQIITLDGLCLNNNPITIEITILEVYPGEKYKDLCIQAIIPIYQ